MDPLLESLNPAQCEAVRHVDGPLLVLAGPGSGKTRVVTHRIAHLLREGVPRAADPRPDVHEQGVRRDAEPRSSELAPGERVWVSTFHRFGARLLRRVRRARRPARRTSRSTTPTTPGRRCSRVIEAGKIRTAHYTPERIAAAISAAKNKLITADQYEPRVGSPLSHVVAAGLPGLPAAAARLVGRRLRRPAAARRQPAVPEPRGAGRARRAIPLHPGRRVPGHQPRPVRDAAGAVGRPPQPRRHRRPRPVDLRLARRRHQQHPAVRVGLPHGARRAAGAELSQHASRCCASPTSSSARTCGASRSRCSPTTTTARRCGSCSTPRRTTRPAASPSEIAERGRRGTRRPRDFAIFYRVNALSRSLERALREHGVPYQMIRGQEFYQRKEIKDVLAYCQLINNPRDDQAVLRTINTPTARHRPQDDRPPRRVRLHPRHSAARRGPRRGADRGPQRRARRRRCSSTPR